MPTATNSPTLQPMHIKITTYNVVCAHGPKLLMVLQAMADINTNITLLTETKLCDEQYARMGHGFSVFAMQALTSQQGGVAFVWQTTVAHWTLEGMQAVTANVTSAKLVLGNQCWLLIGPYLAPSCQPDNKLMATEVEYCHHPRLPVIWMGDFNADLEKDNCDQAIAIATTAQHLGVVDIFCKFTQKKQQ